MSVGVVFLLCLLQTAADGAGGAELVVEVSYPSATGVYLTGGREAGLEVGAVGVLERDGSAAARLVVRVVSAHSALAEILEQTGDDPVRGDRVRFPSLRSREDPSPVASNSAEPEPFVPLLTPRPVHRSSRQDFFQGDLRLSSSLQRDQERDLDYLYYQASSRGSGERLLGGPWSVEWNLDLSSRAGNGYRDASGRGEVKGRVHELTLRRHFAAGHVVAAGRIFSRALPDIGRVDGLLAEAELEGGVRAGLVAGWRPERADLGFSSEELVTAGYASFRPIASESGSLWMTGGVLATWYEGAPDQQALLFAASARRHEVWASASGQVDVYDGGEQVRSGIGLTRLHGGVGARLLSWLSADAGWSQYQLPETDATTDDLSSLEVYDRGHRRISFGLQELLPWQITLAEEISHVSGTGIDGDMRYAARVAKAGLPFCGTLDLAAYRVAGPGTEGHGFSAGYMMALRDDWRLHLLYEGSVQEFDADSSTFGANVLSLFSDWQLSPDTSLFTRAAYTSGDEVRSFALDASVTWRF